MYFEENVFTNVAAKQLFQIYLLFQKPWSLAKCLP